MKTLVEIIMELDDVFDKRSKTGMEDVYVQINDRLVPLAQITCEHSQVVGCGIVILKGEET